jgi:hypothetical protein
VPSNKISNEIVEYDFNSGQSDASGHGIMETKGVVGSAVNSGNTLVVIRATADDSASVDCFNFLSNSWKKLPSAIKARLFSSAVTTTGTFYSNVIIVLEI